MDNLIINIVSIGTLLLIIYIIIDCIRHKTANFLRRVIFYSFVFYVLSVFEYTTGGLLIPPDQQLSGTARIQLLPFQFVLDWIDIYQHRGLDWSFWNSVRLSLYNLIMLLPLGVYLKILFNKEEIRKAALIILLVSLAIETYQIVFSYFGLVYLRAFDVDDIMLNTLSGVVGYYISTVVLERWFSGLLPGKGGASS